VNASRCSNCGAQLPDGAPQEITEKPGLPVFSISLPVLMLLSAVLVAAGAGAVLAIRPAPEPTPVQVAAATETLAPTSSPTATLEPTETPTSEPTATWTPLPPIEYVVAAGDNCGTIANYFNVSSKSIQDLNKLSVDCHLSIGQKLLIPQPTPTPIPSATPTLNPTEIAQLECEKIEYIVKENDLLGGIAANYGVSVESIRLYSGLTSDIVWPDQRLIIPLCEQNLEAPTATPYPPYPAPELLLPARGAYFNPGDVVTLQWSSAGQLRDNERYKVVVEDITDGNARLLVEYVEDTKFNLPEDFRPSGNTPHAFQWYVVTARQISGDKEGEEVTWEEAGEASETRVFMWTGSN